MNLLTTWRQNDTQLTMKLGFNLQLNNTPDLVN